MKSKVSCRKARRSGAALVEMAVCLPLIVLLTFGAIEATNAIFLKQALTEAAHEGARTAASVGKTEEEAIARINQILVLQGIQNSSISISPRITSDTAAGTSMRVTVSAPVLGNTYSGQWYFKDSVMSGTVVMLRQ